MLKSLVEYLDLDGVLFHYLTSDRRKVYMFDVYLCCFFFVAFCMYVVPVLLLNYWCDLKIVFTTIFSLMSGWSHKNTIAIGLELFSKFEKNNEILIHFEALIKRKIFSRRFCRISKLLFAINFKIEKIIYCQSLDSLNHFGWHSCDFLLQLRPCGTDHWEVDDTQDAI